jgi:hypothetical protein
MKYKLIAKEIPGYIEMEAENEHEAILRAQRTGLTVRTVLSMADAPKPDASRKSADAHLTEVINNMVSYIKKLRKDTSEEQKLFWQQQIGMDEELMARFNVLDN